MKSFKIFGDRTYKPQKGTISVTNTSMQVALAKTPGSSNQEPNKRPFDGKEQKKRPYLGETYPINDGSKVQLNGEQLMSSQTNDEIGVPAVTLPKDMDAIQQVSWGLTEHGRRMEQLATIAEVERRDAENAKREITLLHTKLRKKSSEVENLHKALGKLHRDMESANESKSHLSQQLGDMRKYNGDLRTSLLEKRNYSDKLKAEMTVEIEKMNKNMENALANLGVSTCASQREVTLQGKKDKQSDANPEQHSETKSAQQGISESWLTLLLETVRECDRCWTILQAHGS